MEPFSSNVESFVELFRCCLFKFIKRLSPKPWSLFDPLREYLYPVLQTLSSEFAFLYVNLHRFLSSKNFETTPFAVTLVYVMHCKISANILMEGDHEIDVEYGLQGRVCVYDKVTESRPFFISRCNISLVLNTPCWQETDIVDGLDARGLHETFQDPTWPFVPHSLDGPFLCCNNEQYGGVCRSEEKVVKQGDRCSECRVRSCLSSSLFYIFPYAGLC